MASIDINSSSEFEATVDSNDAIAQRLKQHRTEIIKCINPSVLFNCTCEEELAEMELMEESRAKKVEALLNAVESSGKPNAFIQFVRCVEKDSEHLGHSHACCKIIIG